MKDCPFCGRPTYHVNAEAHANCVKKAIRHLKVATVISQTLVLDYDMGLTDSQDRALEGMAREFVKDVGDWSEPKKAAKSPYVLGDWNDPKQAREFVKDP